MTSNQKDPGHEFNQNLQQKIELARWYRRFAELIESGVNLMCSLDTIRQEDFSKKVKDATSKLMDAIHSGATMTDALAELPALTLFPQTVGLIRAGEYGGILEKTARSLANEMNTEIQSN